MRSQVMIFMLCSTLHACGQLNKDRSSTTLIIDPSIKEEVEKHISPSEFAGRQDKLLIYNNQMLVDFYEDNELSISIQDKDDKSTVFKSFYYWYQDTLRIDGAYGLFGGIGFSMKIMDGNASLYHMIAADEFPSHSYTESDSLMFRLEVPCSDSKIILSELPDSTQEKIVYGYVEFKSDDYFASRGSENDQEILPRKKQRVDMRIYFKSALLDLQ